MRLTIGCTILLAKFLPQTIFLEKNKKIRSRYTIDDNEKPVTVDIKKKFEEVMRDIDLPSEKKKSITLFNVYDLNVFHAGTTHSRYGAIIGVPPNFEYKSADDITVESVSFSGVNVDWNTAAGEEFRKSLLLSDSAQKFILAQKILTCNHFSLIMEGINLILDIVFASLIYEFLCLKLHIFKNERLGCFVFIILVAIGGYVMWMVSKNAIDEYITSDVNERLLQLGPQYVEGGVEYYKKLSQRNKALRVLLGDKGTYLFTPTGNEVTWFRTKETSICNQLDYFKSKLQDIQYA